MRQPGGEAALITRDRVDALPHWRRMFRPSNDRSGRFCLPVQTASSSAIGLRAPQAAPSAHLARRMVRSPGRCQRRRDTRDQLIRSVPISVLDNDGIARGHRPGAVRPREPKPVGASTGQTESPRSPDRFACRTRDDGSAPLRFIPVRIVGHDGRSYVASSSSLIVCQGG